MPRRLVEENVRRHDLVAAKYDDCHPEIFNITEQRRLERELEHALRSVRAGHRRALDYGCGTGNLTEKLVRRDMEVLAADISSEMLRVVCQRGAVHVDAGRLRAVRLSGEFPLPFPDRCFAFVAAYSVLHHVPDYLGAVRELARVLDAGGVLYIDHEYNEDHWRSPFGVRLHRLLTMPSYSLGRGVAWMQAVYGKKEPPLPPPGERTVSEEGDIHIYADDHIDWCAIRSVLAEGGLVTAATEDYLLCRETSRFPIRHWLCRSFARDMRTYIGYRPLSP